MLIWWHLEEGFNADVIGGCSACIMNFPWGKVHTIEIMKVHVIYHVLSVITCHFSF